MNLTKKDKVIIFAAHPDDEVLGCGGTIAKLRKKGVQVYIYFFAEGISSRYKSNKVKSLIVKKKIKERNKNALNALKVLNVNKKNIFFENLECCKLDTYGLLYLTKKAEEIIKKVRPSTILTHSPNDINNDHILVNEAVLAAIRPLPKSTVKRILFFEVMSSSEWNTLKVFKPNVFSDITSFFNTKIKSLMNYKNEIYKNNHPRSKHGVTGLAIYRGSQISVKYAEGFQLFRGKLD